MKAIAVTSLFALFILYVFFIIFKNIHISKNNSSALKISSDNQNEIIGIVVGSGDLPLYIINKLDKLSTKYKIVLLKDNPDASLYDAFHDKAEFDIGSVGSIIDHFKNHSIKKIIVVGYIKKPNLDSLKVDFVGSKLLAKLLYRKFRGDDSMLRIVAEFIESYGFDIISPVEMIHDLVLEEGTITERKPNTKHLSDIEEGFKIAKRYSDLDIGQSLIFEKGEVLGLEAIDGTDALIIRCSELQKSNAILIKVAKPSQDLRLDIPVIGPDTIERLHSSKIVGLVIEARKVIVVNYEKTLLLANKYNLFIVVKSVSI